MEKKLYVGNLSYSLNSESLKELFAEAGNVVYAKVIEDRETGRSKGFGFVEFDSEDEAQKAIDLFDGKDHGGRALKVNPAKPRA